MKYVFAVLSLLIFMVSLLGLSPELTVFDYMFVLAHWGLAAVLFGIGAVFHAGDQIAAAIRKRPQPESTDDAKLAERVELLAKLSERVELIAKYKQLEHLAKKKAEHERRKA